MTPEELKHYYNIRPADPLVWSDEFDPDGTLAFGYTCDRYDWHAYLYRGFFHVLILDFNDEVISHEGADGDYAGMAAYRLRPDKRVYPDTVNYKFAVRMRDLDYELPFIGNFDFTTADVLRRQSMGIFKGAYSCLRCQRA